MPYSMNEIQMENVLSLSSEERYLHFLNKVADWEQLWILCDSEGHIYTRSTSEIEYLSVWPHPTYADKFESAIDENLGVSEIPLNEFMDKWLPGLESDGLQVGVFPDSEGKVWIIEPKDLLAELEGECEQYE